MMWQASGPITTVAPTDPALPHLQQALDMLAMAAHFETMVSPHGLLVLDCRLDRAKYRPGRNATLAYRLRLRPAQGGAVLEQRVTARLCSSLADAARRAARVPSAALVASPAGPALRLVPALGMLTWWWPNDPVLVAPRVLADALAMRDQVLPAVVAALGGRADDLPPSATLDVVQYVPEQRLAARVALTWRQDGQPRQALLYAKASREPDVAAAHQRLAELQASPAWRAGRLRTPRAILSQPEHGLHWQQALPGSPWSDLPPARQLALAPRLGDQLAALHATPVAGAPALAGPALHARLAEVVPVLHDALPEARAALAACARALAAGLDALAAGPAGTLHGDLHPRNVLVEADGQADAIALVDLDGVARGPAVLDLGGWAAEGIARARLEGADPMRDQALWQALLQGYAAGGGMRPTPAMMAFATAWCLLTQRAWRSVVNLKCGRLATAPALVDEAARLACAPSMEPA